jgi:hypothetical protein
VHVAAITATSWILLLNALVGFQLLDDGTPLSVGLFAGSAVVLFIGTGYIALDTGFSWTGHFDSSLSGNNRNIGLYVLYLLFPLVCIFFFYILEALLVMRVLGERRPLSMYYSLFVEFDFLTFIVFLTAAALLFAIGQVFDFVVSPHICNPLNGKINGAFFETLFSLLSVVCVWLFWSSITEDDWPAVSSAYN